MFDPAEPTRGAEPTATDLAPQADVPDIRKLIQDYYKDVYRYAFRLAGSVADAEDLTQQTFLTAHRKVDQLRDERKADRWLFAVLRSCFLKSRRRQRPAAAANFELDVDEIPDRTSEEEIDRERLQLALEELADDYRLILVMFYFEQLSYKEIAQQLEIKMGTVMSRLARAKSQLRQQLLASNAVQVPGGTYLGG